MCQCKQWEEYCVQTKHLSAVYTSQGIAVVMDSFVVPNSEKTTHKLLINYSLIYVTHTHTVVSFISITLLYACIVKQCYSRKVHTYLFKALGMTSLIVLWNSPKLESFQAPTALINKYKMQVRWKEQLVYTTWVHLNNMK